MGILTLLGAGPGQAGGGGGVTPAALVAWANYNISGASDSAIPIPPGSGLHPGDIVAVVYISTAGSAAVTLTTNGSSTAMAVRRDNIAFLGWEANLFSVVLSTLDASNGFLTIGGGAAIASEPMTLSVYRGATTLTVQAFGTTNGAGSITQASFPPSGSSKGIIAPAISAPSPGALTISGSPGTWTQAAGSTVMTQPFYSGCVPTELIASPLAPTSFGPFPTNAFQYIAELT